MSNQQSHFHYPVLKVAFYVQKKLLFVTATLVAVFSVYYLMQDVPFQQAIMRGVAFASPFVMFIFVHFVIRGLFAKSTGWLPPVLYSWSAVVHSNVGSLPYERSFTKQLNIRSYGNGDANPFSKSNIMDIEPKFFKGMALFIFTLLLDVTALIIAGVITAPLLVLSGASQ